MRISEELTSRALLNDLTRRVREVDDALKQAPLGRVTEPAATPLGGHVLGCGGEPRVRW